MKILLDGYFDRNLGDDLMLTLAARGLKEHEIYVPPHEINIGNARYTQAKSGFDAYLKVTGSGFVIYNTLGAAYRLRDAYREAKYAPRRAVISCNIGPFANAIGEAAAKPRHFVSSDGFDVYVGRNNTQNDYLTLKFANSSDLWFHTKKIHGSHVIIKLGVNKDVPHETIREAAEAAAYYSKARASSQVPVDYTVVKNVKKPNGAKPGMVIYDGYNTIYVTPKEPRTE